MDLNEISDGARVKRIFYGGIIISLDKKTLHLEAIAIDRKHRVFALGSDEEILSLKETDTEVICLNGNTVLPGFYAAHDHFPKSALQNLNQINLVSEENIPDMKHLIEKLQQGARKSKSR